MKCAPIARACVGRAGRDGDRHPHPSVGMQPRQCGGAPPPALLVARTANVMHVPRLGLQLSAGRLSMLGTLKIPGDRNKM